MAGAGGAAAAETPSAVAMAHLEVQAVPSCSTRDRLAARVAARSQRIRLVDEGATVTSVRAEIAAGPNDSAIAQLTIVDPNGRRSSRRLSAPSCAEATDAIALIIVISLDPRFTPPAAAESDSPPVGVPARPPGGNADRAPRRDAPPANGVPTNRETPTSTGVPTDRETPTSTGAPPRPARRRLGVGAAAELISGPAPRVMPGVAVRAFAAFDRESIWSPALRLTAAHAWQGEIDEPGGTAAFSLDILSLDACPIRLTATIVELRVCATGTAGRLSATGSNTYSPSSQERPFVGLGGSAIVGVEIGSLLELSATFGASDALIRDAFEFSPQVFHQVSAMTLTGDLGLGLRFP